LAKAGRRAQGNLSQLRTISLFSIHLLTASGAFFALLALVAVFNSRLTEMFAWLALAIAIDAIDGSIARKFKVAILLPRWSGEVLDLVVDFLTYVFVPTVAIMIASILPPGFESLAGGAIIISSVIYFGDRNMKTRDGYFRGFPAVWIFVVFYLFLVRPEPWIALTTIAIFVALTFMPILFVHPLRVVRFRPLNLTLCLIWVALSLVVLLEEFGQPRWVTVTLLVIAVYFLIAGFLRRKEGASL